MYCVHLTLHIYNILFWKWYIACCAATHTCKVNQAYCCQTFRGNNIFFQFWSQSLKVNCGRITLRQQISSFSFNANDVIAKISTHGLGGLMQNDFVIVFINFTSIYFLFYVTAYTLNCSFKTICLLRIGDYQIVFDLIQIYLDVSSSKDF